EDHLVVVELALEEERQRLERGDWLRATFEEALEAALVMVAQLRDAPVEAVEDAVVRGEHERVVRKVREAPEGIEEELERVRFRLVAPHGDVGRDARQDLIARDEHAKRFAPERRMLG